MDASRDSRIATAREGPPNAHRIAKGFSTGAWSTSMLFLGVVELGIGIPALLDATVPLPFNSTANNRSCPSEVGVTDQTLNLLVLRISSIMFFGGSLLVAAVVLRHCARSCAVAVRVLVGLASVYHSVAHTASGVAWLVPPKGGCISQAEALPNLARGLTTAGIAVTFLAPCCHESIVMSIAFSVAGLVQSAVFVVEVVVWGNVLPLLLAWGLSLAPAGILLLLGTCGCCCHRCASFQRSLETNITIAADRRQVWKQLIDLPNWGQWNTFIPSIEVVGSPLQPLEPGSPLQPLEPGSPLQPLEPLQSNGTQPVAQVTTIHVGDELAFHVVVPRSPEGNNEGPAIQSAREFDERVRVTRCISDRDFAWRGGLGPGAKTQWPLLFTGEHRFELLAVQEGAATMLRHTESMAGVMVPFIWEWFDSSVRACFESMNRELKARAEASTTTGAVPTTGEAAPPQLTELSTTTGAVPTTGEATPPQLTELAAPLRPDATPLRVDATIGPPGGDPSTPQRRCVALPQGRQRVAWGMFPAMILFTAVAIPGAFLRPWLPYVACLGLITIWLWALLTIGHSDCVFSRMGMANINVVMWFQDAVAVHLIAMLRVVLWASGASLPSKAIGGLWAGVAVLCAGTFVPLASAYGTWFGFGLADRFQKQNVNATVSALGRFSLATVYVTYVFGMMYYLPLALYSVWPCHVPANASTVPAPGAFAVEVPSPNPFRGGAVAFGLMFVAQYVLGFVWMCHVATALAACLMCEALDVDMMFAAPFQLLLMIRIKQSAARSLFPSAWFEPVAE